MPNAHHKAIVHASLERVWGFISHLEKVARCMPGYQGHTELNPTDSLWHLKGDVGIFQRPITFKASIDSAVHHDSIAFSLAGQNENLFGRGMFRAQAVPDGVEIDLELSLEARGVAGPMVNALLSLTLPRDLEHLAAGLVRELETEPS